jgi:hypothetical protein
MRGLIPVWLILAAFTVTGCESSTGSGVLGGVLGGGAAAGGYEYHLNRQKDRVQNEYEDGEMDEEEYEIRMDQIERDSLVQ